MPRAKVSIRTLREQLAAMTRERDAYKRAKGENDDRFMGERDRARMERDAMKAVLLELVTSETALEAWRPGDAEARDSMVLRLNSAWMSAVDVIGMAR